MEKIQLEALFENMTEGVVIQNSRGKVIQFNQAALKILDLSEDQLLGTTSLDPKWMAIKEDLTSLSKDEHPSILALQSGLVQRNQVLGVYRPDGELRWLLVTAVPLFVKGQRNPEQVLVTFHDFTEQALAKAESKFKEEELSRILNSLPALVGHWDKNLINVHANETYSEYFGKRPSEIKGIHIRDLLGPELFAKNLPFMQAALKGETQTFEREIPLPKGGSKHTIASYLPDQRDGEIRGFFVIVTDVTKIKDLEEERRVLESKLVSNSRLAALGEMAGGIAHEINTPLGIIDLNTEWALELLQQGSFDRKKIKELLATVSTTVSRIAKVIKGLRFFARDTDDEEFQLTDVDSLIADTLSFCREKFATHGIDLRVSSPGKSEVECKPMQISQILLNMLNNSHDAVSPLEEKWVEVAVREIGDSVEISVTDSGPGIPRGVQDKLMQPFFTTKEIGKGMGLALSVSKGIAEAHKGRLTYDSSSSNTRFVLNLPKSQKKESKTPVLTL